MPAALACVLRCQPFKGALLTHFADESMQRAIVDALQPTLSSTSMQAAFLALSGALQPSLSTATSPPSDTASTHEVQVGVDVELTSGIPRSDE